MADFDHSQRTRHRLLLIAAAVGLAVLLLTLFASPLSGARAAPPVQQMAAEDGAVLDSISAYLNSIDHLQGGFLQVASDGDLTQGTFYLRRPGRLRFEYEPPTELLVVADGTWVIVQEGDFAAPQRYPIASTPLTLLLDPNVDLRDDATVVGLARHPGQLRVTLTDKSGEAPGTLTLVFDAPDLRLRQWIVKDAQGLETAVALRNVQSGIVADNALFVVRDSTRPAIGGPRR